MDLSLRIKKHWLVDGKRSLFVPTLPSLASIISGLNQQSTNLSAELWVKIRDLGSRRL